VNRPSRAVYGGYATCSARQEPRLAAILDSGPFVSDSPHRFRLRARMPCIRRAAHPVSPPSYHLNGSAVSGTIAEQVRRPTR
jgi:hypothetical protein